MKGLNTKLTYIAGFAAMCWSTAVAQFWAFSKSEPMTISIPTDVNPFPLVINTWNFSNATAKARDTLLANGSAVDAVEQGCRVCEEGKCADSIGFGGHPDENGETTLDSMIMDGRTHSVGSVGALRRVKHAISVARAVMEHSSHSLLVGELATEFALQMGFPEESLGTNKTKLEWEQWKKGNCQPNYWNDVVPNPQKSCGPYWPKDPTKSGQISSPDVGEDNHDTIGMIAIDADGNIAAGTSTNGLKFKIPGRVGDTPIIGAGAYVDADVGAAAGTGDGDTLMKFCPSLVTVEQMRAGLSPHEAAEVALGRIVRYYPEFMGALVAVTAKGQYGAACHGAETFQYCVWNPDFDTVQVFTVPCMKK